MEPFEPLINLLVLLTVLSIASERVTNYMKLKSVKTKTKPKDEKEKRNYEHINQARNIWINLFFALIIKANFFEVIINLKDPWQSLGWVRLEEYHWVVSPMLTNWGNFLLTLVGCVIMGIALGFGSKFWHDILGIIYEMKEVRKKIKEGTVNLPTGQR